MTTHIWLSLRGRALWGLVALVSLGIASLWLETARGIEALWSWLVVGDRVGGWTMVSGVLVSVLGMVLLFFPLAALGRRFFDRGVLVEGSLRSGLDVVLLPERGPIVFWSVSLISCVACLAAQVVRLLGQALVWLGVEWPGTPWLTCGVLSCVAILSWISVRRITDHVVRMVARLDVAHRSVTATEASTRGD